MSSFLRGETAASPYPRPFLHLLSWTFPVEEIELLKSNISATTLNITNTQTVTAFHFRASELTCVSVYCWCATEAVQHNRFSSAQVTLLQCIVGCSNYSSLSSSLSHVPHSRNSTFCLATAIPQMQSWLKANHHRATSSHHDNGHLSHLHLLLALSAAAKYGQNDISFPSLALPLSLHFYNRVLSLCLACTQTAAPFFACRMWMKRGSACASVTSLEA